MNMGEDEIRLQQLFSHLEQDTNQEEDDMSHDTFRGPRNARFWVYVNVGDVKLTLKPDQRLVHNEGGPCEEGYCFTQEVWEHTGRYVVRCLAMEAKDCDGRVEHFWRSRTSICDIPDDHRPDWEDEGSSQRDYSAEAAGY